jgi:hypothetical protein
VTFTRKAFLPLRGGLGSDVSATFDWGAFIVEAAGQKSSRASTTVHDERALIDL